MLNVLDGMPVNEVDIIHSIIDSSFFADYGIVSTVNSDDTINVTHATLPVYYDGNALEKRETYNVEVIYPAGYNMGIKWPIKVGDGVLLIGLKNYIESTNGILEPTDKPDVSVHYTQNTMKAIPLQSVTAPKITISTDGKDLSINNTATLGLIQIKNAAKSLETILENILTHISGITTTNCVVGSPVVLNPATIALFTQDIADLKLLLKA